MSKTYIGQRVREVSTDNLFRPFSRVTIWYDDENAFTAGDDTGRVLELDCPWATQAMADDLLASLTGVAYRPFTATDALLDPAAELGDGITAGGIYGYLLALDAKANPLGAATISAPGDEELDHEYPYLTSEERALKRTVKLGQSYYGTSISRQYGVRVETVDAEGNVIATATFNSDGISFQTPSGSGITLGADGDFHGNLRMDGSISWDDLSEDTQNRVDAGKGDDNPSYIRSTYINEAKIISPDIYGGMFYATGKGAEGGPAYYIYDGATIKSGGNVTLGNKVGYLSYDTNGSGTHENPNRVLLTTLTTEDGENIALKINASGDMSLEAENNIYIHTPLALMDSVGYGTSLPSTAVAGQLFFLEVE